MARYFAYLLVVGAIIWVPSQFYGFSATRKAKDLSAGHYCWMVRHPVNSRSRGGDEMALSLHSRTPFRFWKDMFSFSERFDYVRPHYGIVILGEGAAPKFYAWSYKANDFWDIEKQMTISVFGLFPLSSECKKLLSSHS